MIKLQEPEFKAIKKHLKLSSVKSTAYVMKRSESCIMRIRASRDFEEYTELQRAEHRAKKPRTPLSIQLHNAKVTELMAIKSKGKFGAYRAICQRLNELGV